MKGEPFQTQRIYLSTDIRSLCLLFHRVLPLNIPIVPLIALSTKSNNSLSPHDNFSYEELYWVTSQNSPSMQLLPLFEQ